MMCYAHRRKLPVNWPVLNFLGANRAKFVANQTKDPLLTSVAAPSTAGQIAQLLQARPFVEGTLIESPTTGSFCKRYRTGHEVHP